MHTLAESCAMSLVLAGKQAQATSCDFQVQIRHFQSQVSTHTPAKALQLLPHNRHLKTITCN